MTKINCSADECVYIDRHEMTCTRDEIEYDKYCKTFQMDFEYMRRTLKYRVYGYPVYDDYSDGIVPVLEGVETEEIKSASPRK